MSDKDDPVIQATERDRRRMAVTIPAAAAILLGAGIALSRLPNSLTIGAGIVLLGVLAWCATALIR